MERVLGPRLDHPAVPALLERCGSPVSHVRKAGRRGLVTLLRPKAPLMAGRVVEDILAALDEQRVVVPGADAAALTRHRGQDRSPDPHRRRRRHRLRNRLTSGGLRRPCACHAQIRLVHPRQVPLPTREQATLRSLLPCRLRLTGLLRATVSGTSASPTSRLSVGTRPDPCFEQVRPWPLPSPSAAADRTLTGTQSAEPQGK